MLNLGVFIQQCLDFSSLGVLILINIILTQKYAYLFLSIDSTVLIISACKKKHVYFFKSLTEDELCTAWYRGGVRGLNHTLASANQVWLGFRRITKTDSPVYTSSKHCFTT